MRPSMNSLLQSARLRLMNFTRYCGNSIKVRWAKLYLFTSSFFLMLRTKKLSTSANVSRSYSKNKSGTFLLRHGVVG